MKYVVITGASKGIGKAIAIKMAELGYSVGVCARSSSDLENLKESLQAVQKLPSQIFFSKVVDVSNAEEIKAFGVDCLSIFKTIDVLVNNVGTYLPGLSLLELEESFNTQLDVNLKSVYHLTRTLVPRMMEQLNGHIINICSIAAHSPVVEAGSYSVTKAGMLSLNHVWRRELANKGIKVTAIIPGATFTSSWAESTVDSRVLIQAEDIADCISTVLQLSKNANVDEIKISPLNF